MIFIYLLQKQAAAILPRHNQSALLFLYKNRYRTAHSNLLIIYRIQVLWYNIVVKEVAYVTNPKKAVTIADIAAYTNSSVSTVSRVLSSSSYPVSKERRKAIQDAAKEMGYVPNAIGRMLKSNINRSIAVIVPTLQNPFFLQIIRGAENEAIQRGYHISFHSSRRDPALEQELIHYALQQRIMGIMLISIDKSPDTLQSYLDAGGRTALIEADFTIQNVIHAQTDFIQCGKMAASHLIQSGHKKIALFSPPLTKAARYLSVEGCRSAMAEHSLTLADEDIFIGSLEQELDEGMYEFEVGKKLASQLLRSERSYTAIISTNDLTAFGAIQYFTQKGVKVPQDISVIGMDDIVYSGMFFPPLTSIHQPSVRKGRLACRLLIDELENGTEASDIFINFSPELRKRESVSAPSVSV